MSKIEELRALLDACPPNMRVESGQVYRKKATLVLSFGPQESAPVVVFDLACEVGEALPALLAVAEAARGLRVISTGSGPVAPVFDSHDYEVERNRGAWRVVDGTSMDVLDDALASLEGEAP